ncbi:MAG: hypothetical protein HY923_10220 [Elusimicrobia bacterium]|nr:hypothetical protein [Elusimicrobiota bacterium]
MSFILFSFEALVAAVARLGACALALSVSGLHALDDVEGGGLSLDQLHGFLRSRRFVFAGLIPPRFFIG